MRKNRMTKHWQEDPDDCIPGLALDGDEDSTDQIRDEQDLSKQNTLLLMELLTDNIAYKTWDDRTLKKNKSILDELSSRLQLSTIQVLFLILMINEDNEMSLSSLSRRFDYSRLKAKRLLQPEIDNLLERHIIYKAGRRVYYSLYPEALDTYMKGQTYEYTVPTNLTVSEFFQRLANVIANINEINEPREYNAEWSMIEELLLANPQLSFTSSILNCQRAIGNACMMVLLYMGIEILRGGTEVFPAARISNDLHIDIYGEGALCWQMDELVSRGLVDYLSCDGHTYKDKYVLTKKCCTEVFSGIGLEKQIEDESESHNYLDSKLFPEKKLYYNEEDSEQIIQLGQLLMNDSFNTICERMKSNGMRCGFSCLFYGPPGTGKTETARMLAKQTGRMLIQVNVEEIKSKWVGETEKNIKKVFANYREACNKLKLKPILLFNEADSIFGRRLENIDSSVDAMENSVQNIILQEMETLDGILIATTNLTTNLDKAFERRFLYKIQFSFPNIRTMSNIWRSMIPQLTEEEALRLATKYRMSGGQIENIARKKEVNYVLTGSELNIEEIEKMCDLEIIDTKRVGKIGF